MLKVFPYEAINIVLVGETLLSEAERWMTACERCAENATVSVDCLLDALTGYDPQVTEYLMARPARCPSCASEIYETTCVAV